MLKINLNSPEPIYEQLVQEIKRMIEHDVLKEGDSLPTIRSLASQLDVANNTVARAY
ncbi:MAG: GntR family transcriptional regulator, partial [bacterium]|nr:GntR family transcriptional regulator [bacterium]